MVWLPPLPASAHRHLGFPQARIQSEHGHSDQRAYLLAACFIGGERPTQEQIQNSHTLSFSPASSFSLPDSPQPAFGSGQISV